MDYPVDAARDGVRRIRRLAGDQGWRSHRPAKPEKVECAGFVTVRGK